jgi:5-carboxymethyl-2-hydroxymuconate isomerase
LVLTLQTTIEAFIYLELLLLEGRSLPKLQEAGKQLLKILEKCFSQSILGMDTQIAVRVVELSKNRYFKIELKNE